jgi:hypothetical protein
MRKVSKSNLILIGINNRLTDEDILLNQWGAVPVRAKPNDLSGAHDYGPVQPGPNASHIHVNGEHVPVPSGYTPPSNANVIQ